MSYFRDLRKNDPQSGVGNSATATQKVVEGGFAVAVTSSQSAVDTSKKLGVPLAVGFPKEVPVMIGWSLGILANSPHPAAAKLCMDFLLSNDAEELLVQKEAITAARNDVTMPPELAPFAPATLQDAHAIPVDSMVPKATLDQYRSEFEGIVK